MPTNNHTVQLKTIPPKTTAYVRGKLQYAQLIRPIDGIALQRKIEREKARGRKTIVDKPHRTVTLTNAVIEFPQNNMLETYVTEHMYDSIAHPENNKMYQADVKGKYAPYFYTRDNNQLNEFVPEGELANGLDVTIVFEVYATSLGNGLGIKSVIVNEPVAYYNVSTDPILAANGLTVNSLTRDEREAQRAQVDANAEEAAAAAQTATQPTPQPPVMPAYSAPQNQAQPYQPPYQGYNPYAAPQPPVAPTQAPVQQAPQNPNGFQNAPVQPGAPGIAWGDENT